MSDTVPVFEPRLLGRREAAAALGIGLSKVKELLASGELESVRIGDRRLVPSDALDAYVARLRGTQ